MIKRNVFKVLLAILIVIASIATNAFSSAQVPQFALMFLQSGKNTDVSTGVIILEQKADNLKTVERKSYSNYYNDGFWSPQSKTFTFIKDNNVIVRNKTHPSEIIESERLEYFIGPNASPDGRYVVYISKIESEDEHTPAHYSLKMTNLGGTTSTIFQSDNIYFYISSARWSPDGSYIAFGGQPFGELSEGSVYLISTKCLDPVTSAICPYEELTIKDGSGKRLPGRVTKPVNQENWNWPTWSPDGMRLAFRCGFNTCTLNRDGTNFQRVLVNTDIDIQWSPDGRYLAYQVIMDGGYDIFLFNLATSQEVNFTNTPDISEENPRWLSWPDAKFLFE
jgi:Tol biopolymer transport system component